MLPTLTFFHDLPIDFLLTAAAPGSCRDSHKQANKRFMSLLLPGPNHNLHCRICDFHRL
jgi:hypothetical protein